MSPDNRFTASEDVAARTVGEEMVILNLQTGLYFGLSGVGARVWDLLSGDSNSVAQLGDAIEAEFDAPRSEIERDMEALLRDLLDKELIVPA